MARQSPALSAERRVRWLKQEEARRLIAELPDHLAAMMRFTLATRLRESNVTQLEWEQVDLQRRCLWIHADQSKAKKTITVPLNNQALSVLREQMGKNEMFVFTYTIASLFFAKDSFGIPPVNRQKITRRVLLPAAAPIRPSSSRLFRTPPLHNSLPK